MTPDERARLKVLVEALKPWLKHPDDCGATKPPYSYCSCGLNYAYGSTLAALLQPVGQLDARTPEWKETAGNLSIGRTDAKAPVGQEEPSRRMCPLCGGKSDAHLRTCDSCRDRYRSMSHPTAVAKASAEGEKP